MDKHFSIQAKSISIILTICLSLCSNLAYSSSSINLTTPRTLNFSYDRDLSMHVGSDLSQAALWAYQLTDDSLISSTEGDQRVTMMFARFGKALVENFFANWLMVFQHERFGHGARAREFNLPIRSYSVSAYSGSTSYLVADYNTLTPFQRAAFTTGGMEGTSTVAYDLRNKWIQDDAVDVRTAQLYFATYLDQTNYIFGTSDSDTTAGNDVTAYVNLLNTWYGTPDTITKKKLRSRSMFDLLDPFLFYSIYGMANYIVTGEQIFDYYMIPIGSFKYLPSFRTVLTPWGPETQFSNYLKNSHGDLLYLSLRHGKTGDQSSNGITFKLSDLFSWESLTFNGRADLWKQPNINAASSALAKSRLGFALFSTGTYIVNNNFKVFGQLGYKTDGFIQGEPLTDGFIFRAGIGCNLG